MTSPAGICGMRLPHRTQATEQHGSDDDRPCGVPQPHLGASCPARFRRLRGRAARERRVQPAPRGATAAGMPGDTGRRPRAPPTARDMQGSAPRAESWRRPTVCQHTGQAVAQRLPDGEPASASPVNGNPPRPSATRAARHQRARRRASVVVMAITPIARNSAPRPARDALHRGRRRSECRRCPPQGPCLARPRSRPSG